MEVYVTGRTPGDLRRTAAAAGLQEIDGGLVPALLCAKSGIHHAGTTDVDVQVDLETSSGAVHAARLENALRAAGFRPDNQHVWRWRSVVGSEDAVVKFELLADLDTEPAEAIIKFTGCQNLGAVNLRGTGNAAQDSEVHILTAVDEGVPRQAEANVTGLGGFLLAKSSRCPFPAQAEGLVRHRIRPAAQ